MTTFNNEQYGKAIADWATCCTNYQLIQQLLPTNFVFELTPDQIEWLKNTNKNKNFCTEIGVYSNQLVLILCPLDNSGQKIPVTDHPYSVLAKLKSDLTLMEKQEYTVVKNAVLSQELCNIDHNSNMFLPVSNVPIMDQDMALAAIESWRTEGMTWFYMECSEFKGSRIFKKFLVPADDLTPMKDNLSGIVCSFGLKFSDIYQRTLVTLIFISQYQENLESNGVSTQTISNTYDWSQPCPPICNI